VTGFHGNEFFIWCLQTVTWNETNHNHKLVCMSIHSHNAQSWKRSDNKIEFLSVGIILLK